VRGTNQDHRFRRSVQEREQHRHTDRGARHDHRDRGDDEFRDPPRRRSASLRRSRPLSRSRPHSRDRHQSRSESPVPTPPPEDKAKPNFAPSGLLAAATNTAKNSEHVAQVQRAARGSQAPCLVETVRFQGRRASRCVSSSPSTLSFSTTRPYPLLTRPFVLLLGFSSDLLHIHRQSAYLIGRDRTVTDVPIEHPSCSKQHAVIQYT
jgi:smad nuclear-interacting protein 1